MSAVNQDFITYAGDSVRPIFTVVDQNNAPVDISSISDISWSARLNLQKPIVLTKKKSTGGIVFTGSGTDGRFTLILAASDTLSLSGWFIHQASITRRIRQRYDGNYRPDECWSCAELDLGPWLGRDRRSLYGATTHRRYCSERSIAERSANQMGALGIFKCVAGGGGMRAQYLSGICSAS